jgi:hypothetical protein
MLELALCGFAFVTCFVAVRRSLAAGVAATLTVGFLYGILRANLPDPASHFLFDSGVVGLYAGLWLRPLTAIQRYRVRNLMPWVVCLITWPLILFFIPLRDPLIQLVGLRSQIMFLPFLLIGARLDAGELYALSLWVAMLCLVAFGFAGAEWLLGVPRFFPRVRGVTELIYLSNDVTTSGGLRIPATFVNSAAYAETMVVGMPLLVGAWVQKRGVNWQRWLIVAAVAASALGTFMAASRVHAAILIGLAASLCVSGALGRKSRLIWLLIVAAVACAVATQPRLQRFETLRNTRNVERRVTESLNSQFLELAEEHPIGRGLGGGGTSVPYFLRGRVGNGVGMENEYARIMLEEGIPGLCLWLAFIVWLLTRRAARHDDPWSLGRSLARTTCGAYFAAAAIGTGLLTAIPGTPMLLLLAGCVASGRPHAVAQAMLSRDAAARANYAPMRRYGW